MDDGRTGAWMTPPALEVENLVVSYGKRRAVDGISLTVGAGEIVTLLGANGSGKSTMLRAISGLVRPRSGRVVYEGHDLTRAAPDAVVATGVGHVPEGREVFAEFTVLENLLVGAHLAPRTEIAERLEAAFTVFPRLRERQRQTASTLSGGEQQMLAIARALMARPRLLLLDEPSLGLAPMLSREIFRVIRRINASGVTVLLVEQNARRALALAARGYVLETGRVAVAGTSAELIADPRIRAAYLGLDRVRGTAPRNSTNAVGAQDPETSPRSLPGPRSIDRPDSE
jgi:branched-chain amino acid transport system ATP-binding protein